MTSHAAAPVPPWRRSDEGRSADVYVGDILAARLVRHTDRTVLRPLGEHPPQISFGMPAGVEVVASGGGAVPPFFSGLLPEGYRLTALLRWAKRSADDYFGLLLEVGEDCIGDVAVVPEGHRPDTSSAPRTSVSTDGSDPADLSFVELLEERLGIGSTHFDRAGMAGVHPKLSTSEMLALVEPHSIVKFSPPDLPRLIENEAFFMAMAGECGLRVAPTRVVRDREGMAALVVSRFDRIRRKKQIDRVHVEDSCQFLGRHPADKYDLSYNEIAAGIAQFASAPPLAVLDLLALIGFSYLIGNGDLHAKNVSLWRRPSTAIIELSPVYDLVSTIAYRGGDRLALKLDGRDDDLRRMHLVEFGRRHHVGQKAIERRLDQMCDLVPAYAEQVGSIGYADRISSRLSRELLRRRDQLGSSRGSD